MPLHLYYDENKVVKVASTKPLKNNNKYRHILYHGVTQDVVGKKIREEKDNEKMKVALICNWGDQCGISTYTKFLVDAIKPHVELKIFSEKEVWQRGRSMEGAVRQVLNWKPTIVLIQHEFGLFPRATHFMTMMEQLSHIPTLITLHSVYEHRDKAVCTAVIPNIVVHSESAKNCLRKLGHNHQNIYVIPHGCVNYGTVEQNYNMFGGPTLIQFGFGFKYKGVEVAIDALKLIKRKIPNIFYCYLCSESPHTPSIINEYYYSLKRMITTDISDNITIQKGFFSDDELNQYLRTAQCAIFPYVIDPKHIVYGASGAVRIAMANNIPTIVSNSYMFDDLDGVLPRPKNSGELADEVIKVLTDNKYRKMILDRQRLYINENKWNKVGQKYIMTMKDVVQNFYKDHIYV